MAENKRKRDETQVEEEETAKKPSGENVITLKVKCNDKGGPELVFNVSRRSKLKKLLMNFCRHIEIDYRSTRFVINHRAFSHDKSPNQLKLEDYDQIDALVDGNGG